MITRPFKLRGRGSLDLRPDTTKSTLDDFWDNVAAVVERRFV